MIQMTSVIKNSWLLGVAALAVAMSAQARGASFDFFSDYRTISTSGTISTISTNSSGVYTNRDGISPTSLISSGNTLYGTAKQGGTGGNGTVFKFNADGTGFSTLHSFAESSTNSSGIYTNYDGANPSRRLILSGNSLYGVASAGGSLGNGTVFKVNTDGTGFSVLHTGTGSMGGLALSGNTLFGTTPQTVFAVNTDGTGFTNLHDFTGSGDGISVGGGLVASSNSLFGSFSSITSKDRTATVFKLNTDGTGFTTLLRVDAILAAETLILWGNTLYGIAYNRGSGLGGGLGCGGGLGGAGGGLGSCVDLGPSGTIFKLNTDGTAYSVLVSGSPHEGLVAANDTLYCIMTYSQVSGGPAGIGSFGGGGDGSFTVIQSNALLAINADGTGSTSLPLGYFGNLSDVYAPTDVALSGKALFWIYYGVISSFTPTPKLSVHPSGPSVLVTWPTNYAGFDYSGYALESTENLDSPAWTTNFPAPAMVNGQKSVTVPLVGTRQFFRLKQ